MGGRRQWSKLTPTEATLKRKLPLTLLILAGTLGATLLANMLFWQGLQLHFEDWILEVSSPMEPDQRVVIVGIDDISFREMERAWPWPRTTQAKLIANIAAADPSVIGFDILLTEARPEDRGGDEALGKALEEADSVVLLEKLVFEGMGGPGSATVVDPAAPFRQNTRTGFFNLAMDSDLTIRRQRLLARAQGEFKPSFAYRIALEHSLGRTGADATLQSHESSALRLAPGANPVLRFPYRGPAGTFPIIPAHLVLSGKIPKQVFEGRIVLVGATFSDTKDQWAVPVEGASGSSHMFGIEVHANVVTALLEQRSITDPVGNFRWLLVPLVVLVMVVVGMFVSLRAATLLGVVLALLVIIGGFLGLTSSLTKLPTIQLLVAVISGTMLALACRFATGERERRRIRGILAKVMSEQVASELIDQESGVGETRDQVVSVVFTDIRNFTGISEKVPRDELVKHLNEYFQVMNEVVATHGGVVNKYIGDAMMVIFGLDPKQTDHAERACRCALEIVATARKLARKWESGSGIVFETGAGINTGQVSVGLFGSEGHFEYTVIGDEVNLASRLEGLTKDHPVDVIIGERTARQVKSHAQLKELGKIRVRGKTVPVEIFGLQDMSKAVHANP